MRVQFHVVVIDRGPIALLADGGAVHQLPYADQHAIDEDRTIWRQQEVGVRTLSAKALRSMRIGATVSGRGCLVRSIRRWPTHLTVRGTVWPSIRTTICLPGRSFSTGSSPLGVRIIVPRTADNSRDRYGSDLERRRRTGGGAEIVEDEGSTSRLRNGQGMGSRIVGVRISSGSKDASCRM